jgi:membrane-associated phospholipid phosphatase
LATNANARQLIKNDPYGPTLLPGWKRIEFAVIHAVSSPLTYVPAVIASGVYLTRSDKGISEWASARNPVFGSQKTAENMSNILRNSSMLAYLATEAALPIVKHDDLMFTSAMGAVAGLAAVNLTNVSTNLIKSEAARVRPDASDNLSFPSGHTSTSSVFTTLAAHNIEEMQLGTPWETALQGGLAFLTIGTGWARVEANKHYLSDVLVGAALGHFIGAFVSDAFLGEASPVKMDMNLKTSGKNPGAGINISFELPN